MLEPWSLKHLEICLPGSIYGDDDFAEVAAGFEVVDGGSGVGEGEGGIDDGGEGRGAEKVDYLGEHGARTDVDAVEADAFAEDLHGLNFARSSG